MKNILLILAFFYLPIHSFGITEHSKISILTYEPGVEVYAVFGHIAIRVRDSTLNIDKVYNYGTFDLSSPLFYVKYFRGNLDYFLSVINYKKFIHYEALDHRKIHEQILTLTNNEKQDIYLKLEQTYHSKERFYRYSFFYDNCATRVRDIILNSRSKPISYDTSKYCCSTFRELIKPYVSKNYWVDLVINLGLGSEGDKPASSNDFMFLPDYIFQIFRDSGITEPSKIMLDPSPFKANSKFLDIYILILILTVIYILIALKRTRNLIFYLYHSVIAFVGLFLTLLTFFSENSALRDNYNVVWTIPALLIIILSKSKYIKTAELVYMFLLLLVIVLQEHLLPGFSVTFLPWIITLIVIYIIDLQWINRLKIYIARKPLQ